jgi:hypothetical protein
MREIRQSGLVGGAGSSIPVPTPIEDPPQPGIDGAMPSMATPLVVAISAPSLPRLCRNALEEADLAEGGEVV